MVMLVIACVVGTLVVVDEASRIGYLRSLTLRVATVAYVTGIAGAAAVPVVHGLIRLVGTGRFATGAGLAAYGGILGGVAGSAWVLRREKKPVLPFLDAGIPAIGLGYFIARIGCFLAGCDYGVPTQSRLAVSYPRGSYAFIDHVSRGLIPEDVLFSAPVHATQLYSALSGLGLYLVVKRLPVRGDGSRFFAFMLGYAVLRFFIEMLRGDASRGAVMGLSTSQIIAMLSVVLVLGWKYHRRAQGAGPV